MCPFDITSLSTKFLNPSVMFQSLYSIMNYNPEHLILVVFTIFNTHIWWRWTSFK